MNRHPARDGPFVLDRFVAIDVEVASKSPPKICAIGAVRVERGVEVAAFESLVHTEAPVRYTSIHGLTADKLATAPAWPAVWTDLLQFLGGIRVLVAFRADFDRGAILTACGMHGLRVPALSFICAAGIAEKQLGRRLDLRSALAALEIPYPGRAHDALSDARAAAALILATVSPVASKPLFSCHRA